MTSRPAELVVCCYWSESDIQSIAEEYGIDPDIATARIEEWGGAIEATANALISDQLTSVIRYNTP